MLSNLRFACRSLLKSPGFTVIALLTLALGIGANTAVFSLIKSILLHPLPYPDPGQIVFLHQKIGALDKASLAWPELQDWRQHNHTFAAIAGIRQETYRLTGRAEPELLKGEQVSAEFFEVVRMPMALGRAFTAAEDKPGAPGLAVLSYAFWQRRFDGNASVIGQTLTLNDQLYSIIGVLPREYDLLNEDAEVWTQLGRATGTPEWQSRSNHFGLYALGRIKPGISFEQAMADLQHITLRVQKEMGAAPTISVGGEKLIDNTVDRYRRGLWLLFGAVGLVLLIACANIANLTLTRSLAREGDWALRSALGASRGHLMRQMLGESLVLAFAGGALGLIFAARALQGAVVLKPPGLAAAALFEEASIDQGVLAATFCVSILTAVLCGLWPAWKYSRPDLHPVLQSGGRGGSADRGVTHTREALIVVQVALTVTLLVGAGLLLRSFARAQEADLGFDSRGLLTASLILPQNVYDSEEKLRLFNESVLTRLNALPGVQSADIASDMPLNAHWHERYAIDGESHVIDGRSPFVQMSAVSDGYFRTMGIPLLLGRAFDARDVAGSAASVIIDQSFGQRHWPRESAIGKKIFFGNGIVGIVVGLVPTVRVRGYNVEPGMVQAYVSLRQKTPNASMLVIRAEHDAASLTSAVLRPNFRTSVVGPYSPS